MGRKESNQTNKSMVLKMSLKFIQHYLYEIYVSILEVPDLPTTEIPDTIPVSSSIDWQAAFGFGQQNKNKEYQDDDLGRVEGCQF